MEFIDLNGRASTLALPSEAISINGQALDTVVQGFRTVSVKGRESMAASIRTSGEIEGLDGELLLGSNLRSREITVTFNLSAPSAADFITRFDALKALLFADGGLKGLTFRDETYTYDAVAVMISPPDEGVLDAISDIVFYCPSPYKYKSPATVKTGASQVGITSATANIPVKMQKIELTVMSAGEVYVTNTNNGQRINFSGVFAAGDTIIINFDTKRVVINGAAANNRLAFDTSTFVGFKALHGHTIAAQNVNVVKVTYWERAL